MTERPTRCPLDGAAVQQRFFRALNRVVEPAVRYGVGGSLVGPGAFVLETTGRRTGLARRVPLAGARLGDTIVVSTVRRDSQWVRNAEARPDVRVWLGGHPVPATAEVVRVGGATLARLHIDRPAPARP